MAETTEQVRQKLKALTQPGFRGRLGARGAARAMVWRQGVAPPDGPNFGPLLTQELLSYGFGLLRVALSARELQLEDDEVGRAFELAAEALESVVRNGDPNDEIRGFYRIVAGAAYHLGKFSARAYSLLTQETGTPNLATPEKALGLLILRKLDELQLLLIAHINSEDTTDDRVFEKLQDSEMSFDVDDALIASTTETYLRALADFLFALRSDSSEIMKRALERLKDGEDVCAESAMIPMWWINRITRYLLDALWATSIQRLLPRDAGDGSSWAPLRDLFVALLAGRATAELDLWPSQVEVASRVLEVNDDIVASLPTSAGKTRVAELCILRTLSLNQRVVFVTPLRALSAQTERTLRATFGLLGFDVSSLYGSAGASSSDLDSLANRNIVVSTPEKLDFALRNNPDLLSDVGLIVFDEGHMLGPSEREVRYEVLIQRLLRRPDSKSRRIVCLSAMLPSGDQLTDFVGWLRDDSPGHAMTSTWRPTRQRFGEIIWTGTSARYELRIEDETTFTNGFVRLRTKLGPKGGKKRFPDQQNDLVLASAWRLAEEKHSVLIYCPERRSVTAIAKRILTLQHEGFLGTLPGFNPAPFSKALAVAAEWLGSDHPVTRCLALGVAVHHGALPRAFLRELDVLIRDKNVQIIVASPTLSRGLNISASCVVFQSCERFNVATGRRGLIPVEEFSNVAGRAGRAYVDVDGQVLGVFFKGADSYKWKELIAAHTQRTLESGLLRLVFPLCRQLLAKLGANDDPVEFILNNSEVWQEPQGDENALLEWRRALSILDVALISLIEERECSVDNVAEVLDEILTSSFLRRRLARRTTEVQNIVDALLKRRAKHICASTTANQRRGYFFSGVGLSAGQFLDANSAELNGDLLSADKALVEGDSDACVAATVRIAERVFEIDPFRPNVLLENWREILKAWLLGKPMSEMPVLSDDAPSFVEDALIYRLVWAIEAIRVRSRANEEFIFDDKPSPLAAALETGTLSISQAVLLQAGLSSRIAASVALSQFPADFQRFREMREWLFSVPLVAATAQDQWPTTESRSSWLEFVESQRLGNLVKWGVLAQEIPISPSARGQSIAAGDKVFLWQTPGSSNIRVFSPDLDEVGSTKNVFKDWATPWALGEVISKQSVRITYVGPVAMI